MSTPYLRLVKCGERGDGDVRTLRTRAFDAFCRHLASVAVMRVDALIVDLRRRGLDAEAEEVTRARDSIMRVLGRLHDREDHA